VTSLPYVLRHLHKNLQRAASFALCVSRAPKSRSVTAVQLAAEYAQLMQRRIPVPAAAAERASRYLIGKGLAPRGVTAGVAERELIDRLRSGEALMEVQDWFLSDPRMPSSTGRESAGSFAETVAACAELQFLAEETLVLDSFGELLLAVAEDRGILQATSADGVANQFLPDPRLTTVLIFQLLRCDMIFQRELSQALPHTPVSFTEDLVPLVPGLLRNVALKTPTTVANRDLHGWLRRQIGNADSLALRSYPGQKVTGRSGRAVAPQTLLRPLEGMLVPRMELLVDVGVARKPAPERYAYEVTETFKTYKELTDGGQAGLDSNFFAATARINGLRASPLTDPELILDHLRVGASRLKGLTGYAGIVESTLFANVSAMNNPWLFVELADAQDALRKMAGAANPKVRVIADRFRRPRDFALIS
jgi:hypothetical protein